MISTVIEPIREHYDRIVPIIVRKDGGFFGG
jgi:hypothetical protein